MKIHQTTQETVTVLKDLARNTKDVYDFQKACDQAMLEIDHNTCTVLYLLLTDEGQNSERYLFLRNNANSVLMITTAYEQGVGKGQQAYRRKQEIENPYAPGDCHEAWQLGYKEATPPAIEYVGGGEP